MTATKGRNAKTIRENVKTLLKKFPETRNNDKLLFSYYWYMFDQVDFDGNVDDFVETFQKATPPSSIQRQRQSLQYENEDMKKYQPTDPSVLIYRKKKELIVQDEVLKKAFLEEQR